MHPPDNQVRLQLLISAMVSRLPAILADVGQLLGERYPDSAPVFADHRAAVLAVAEGFCARLGDLLEPATGTAPRLLISEREHALVEHLGRGHPHDQQARTALLAAYHSGATVIWRHLVAAAVHQGVAAHTLAGLASTLFTTLNQLSSASLRGPAQAPTSPGQAQTRWRDELAELLLSDRADPTTVRAAADRAAWPLPHQAAIILIHPDHALARSLLPRLGPTCLQRSRAQTLIGIMPDPAGPGRRTHLVTTLRGARAIIGTTVAVTQLSTSLALADHALRLQQARVLTDDPLFVDEHLPALVAHQDPHLLTALRHRHLAPLTPLPPPTRQRLTQTLRSWLIHLGDHTAIATHLHLHPRTVRYRLRQLRELFGPALDDPTTRAVLLLALAWDPALTHPEAIPHAPAPPHPTPTVSDQDNTTVTGRR